MHPYTDDWEAHMTDSNAKEPVNKNIKHYSILEKSALLSEDNNGQYLSWSSEDMDLNNDSTNRDFIRKQAKNHIDSIIAEKIDNIASDDVDNMDEILEKISIERQLKREEFKSTCDKDDNLDDKLDRDIDFIIGKIIKTNEKAQAEIIGKIRRLLIKLNPALFFVSSKEALLSDKMARGVDWFDKNLDKLLNKAICSINQSAGIIKIQKSKSDKWCRAHKRQIIIGASAFTVLIGVTSMALNHFTAYEYSYNGKVLGLVKDQKDVYSTIDIIGDRLSYAYGAEITIDKEKDISFEKTMGWSLKVDNQEDVLNQFTYMRDMNAIGYAINVDGRRKVVLYSKECAEKVLKDIQNSYLKEDGQVSYSDICFAEKVDIAEVDTKIGNIQKEENALEYMMTGAIEKKIYTVEAGDTFNQIAKNMGLKIEDLMNANPGANPERLQIGQELVLNKICPVVTVETTELAEYLLAIEYDINYEETSSLYKGEQTVKSQGVNGQKEVTARIVRHNGVEVERTEISSNIISEPKNQVVLRGTKELPPLIGTGKLIYPTRGRLSSGFGSRWGRMHNGIDLAASTGTKIKAADGGLVISAGWEGALGYCVRIDHGQNKTTVYGHCSKLFVKKGDRVYQDQHIANVGNTGNSTGPHLHFEVHVKGVPQNPLKYLN